MSKQSSWYCDWIRRRGAAGDDAVSSRHIARCPDCQETLAAFHEMDSRLRALPDPLPPPNPPADLWNRINAGIADRRPTPFYFQPAWAGIALGATFLALGFVFSPWRSAPRQVADNRIAPSPLARVAPNKPAPRSAPPANPAAGMNAPESNGMNAPDAAGMNYPDAEMNAPDASGFNAPDAMGMNGPASGLNGPDAALVPDASGYPADTFPYGATPPHARPTAPPKPLAIHMQGPAPPAARTPLNAPLASEEKPTALGQIAKSAPPPALRETPDELMDAPAPSVLPRSAPPAAGVERTERTETSSLMSKAAPGALGASQDKDSLDAEASLNNGKTMSRDYPARSLPLLMGRKKGSAQAGRNRSILSPSAPKPETVPSPADSPTEGTLNRAPAASTETLAPIPPPAENSPSGTGIGVALPAAPPLPAASPRPRGERRPKGTDSSLTQKKAEAVRLTRQGQRYLRVGNRAAALRAFENALKVYPGYAAARRALTAMKAKKR